MNTNSEAIKPIRNTRNDFSNKSSALNSTTTSAISGSN